MTSLIQQKQNRLLICYFPNYKLVESFDPPREHQHKFRQRITFFPSMGSQKVRSVPAMQSLSVI